MICGQFQAKMSDIKHMISIIESILLRLHAVRGRILGAKFWREAWLV